ncbi:peptidase family C78-domain-containing protein [Mycena pura]|uniref:Peptidase family C78-domain-containing protein n=1 Tax=Mycena pura TaxID=153505 RepID=A0AAD6UXD3_9AGAR|nr:peptidase family C78-domain-containing protein [Mycena pura]
MSYTLSGGRINEHEPTSFPCQFCLTNLQCLSDIQRQQHYDRHLGDEPIASTSTSSPKKSVDNSDAEARKGGSSTKDKNNDRFWYPAQNSEPPPNFTPGLIPLLKTHLRISHTQGYTRRAVLCYERAVLVTRKAWDAGWGCGYRNFLMACASLMDQPFQLMYFPLLDDPIPPGVRNLQRIIEDAWKAGFDPEGARDLKKLVGTKTKIGTADIQIAFTFRGIPSRLVEFDLKKKEGGTDILTKWVIEYFSQPHGVVEEINVLRPKTVSEALLGATPVVVTSRMPFILQHDGHSRTIIGYEVNKSGEINLLEFDPSKIMKKSMRQAALDTFASMPLQHNTVPNASTSNAAASLSNKRPATALSLTNSTPLKRSRCDDDAKEDSWIDDDDVVIIDNPHSQGVQEKMHKEKKKADHALATTEVLKFFRLNHRKLGKNKEYQVLYFPMSEPLSAEAKLLPLVNGYAEKLFK